MNDHHTMVYRLMENYKILKETDVIIIITIFNFGRFVDDATKSMGSWAIPRNLELCCNIHLVQTLFMSVK